MPKVLLVALPILILYPHSRCNCRCTMCDIWRNTTRAEMAVEDVLRWVGEWEALGVERIVLSGGEALMHSRLWEICDGLNRVGIGVTLLSTGLLLRRHAREVARYSDDVVVSLDGPRDVHDAIRRTQRARWVRRPPRTRQRPVSRWTPARTFFNGSRVPGMRRPSRGTRYSNCCRGLMRPRNVVTNSGVERPLRAAMKYGFLM